MGRRDPLRIDFFLETLSLIVTTVTDSDVIAVTVTTFSTAVTFTNFPRFLPSTLAARASRGGLYLGRDD